VVAHTRRDLAVGLRGERWSQGEQLEQHRAEREHVTAAVHTSGVAALLGRHVRRGPQMIAAARQLFAPVGAREAEVEQHRLLVFVEDDVARLQVAMHHAALVRHVQRARDLFHPTESGVGAQSRAGVAGLRQEPCEGRAGVIAHHQIGDAAVDARVVHRTDAGMIEPRGERGLAQKALQRGARRERDAIEHFDRHVAIEPRVGGEEHRALATAPELAQQSVWAELRRRLPHLADLGFELGIQCGHR
jgi:hypothetical protein